MFTIREETPEDYSSIFEINKQAFGQELESKLIDALRKSGALLLSLVAELDGEIVAHIAYSEAPIVNEDVTVQAVCIAPLAVKPSHQKMGYGTAIIRMSFDILTERGYSIVLVMGHAEYYLRFGFEKASAYGIHWEHEYPDEAFMVKVLKTSALDGVSGTVHFRPEFGEF